MSNRIPIFILIFCISVIYVAGAQIIGALVILTVRQAGHERRYRNFPDGPWHQFQLAIAAIFWPVTLYVLVVQSAASAIVRVMSKLVHK